MGRNLRNTVKDSGDRVFTCPTVNSEAQPITASSYVWVKSWHFTYLVFWATTPLVQWWYWCGTDVGNLGVVMKVKRAIGKSCSLITWKLWFYLEPRALLGATCYFPGFSVQLEELMVIQNLINQSTGFVMIFPVRIFQIISIVELGFGSSPKRSPSPACTASRLNILRLIPACLPNFAPKNFQWKFPASSSWKPLSWNADQQSLLSLSCHKSCWLFHVYWSHWG